MRCDVLDDFGDRSSDVGGPVLGEIGVRIRRIDGALGEEISESLDLAADFIGGDGSKLLDVSHMLG